MVQECILSIIKYNVYFCVSVSVFVFDIIYIHVCCVIFLSRFRELLSRIWWSSLLPEIYTHLRWDVCFVSYTTKGCCVEKFGLRERKLSAVFSILLIFGGLFKAWWTVNSQKWYLFLYFYLLWYNNIYINGNTHILFCLFSCSHNCKLFFFWGISKYVISKRFTINLYFIYLA